LHAYGRRSSQENNYNNAENKDQIIAAIKCV
jgi:hypothetical protein